MKNRFLLFSLFACLFGTLQAQQTPQAGLKQITEADAKEYIDFLSSDAMRGRSTPSKELDEAGRYIAGKFREFGIRPVNGSYFQEIPFCYKDLNTGQCHFTLTVGDTTHTFALKENFTPLFYSGENSVEAPVVFAGYGITAPEYGYDDYKNIDAKGKIVLVMKEEPAKNDENSIFNGKARTRYSDISYKINNAIEHGAAALLLVTDPLDNLAITAQGYPWSSLYAKRKGRPSYAVCNETQSIPAVQVDYRVINFIFGSLDSLKTWQAAIDKEMQPRSFAPQNTHARLSVTFTRDDYPASNIVGWMEGTDPKLKNEFLVIGAHYDHLGVSPFPLANDSIYNGADDNASGTAGVMAVAKAFAKSGQKPRRSVIFMLFAAEEIGLIGSQYYTDNPLFPLDKTVAMLNLDMIGRNGTDTLYVIGERYNPDLTVLINSEIPNTSLKKEKMEGPFDLYSASDYAPFYRKSISAIGFTSGLHQDYHQVSDAPHTINHTKVARIAQLTYRVAWQIANSDKYFKTIHP